MQVLNNTRKIKRQVLSKIPFSGFYYSDHEINLQDLTIGIKNVTPGIASLWKELYYHNDFLWSKCFEHYAKHAYLPEFASHLESIIGTDINPWDIEFYAVSEPTEPTFESNSIYCYISDKILGRCFWKVVTSPELSSSMDYICTMLFTNLTSDGIYLYEWRKWESEYLFWSVDQCHALITSLVLENGCLPESLNSIDNKDNHIEDCLRAGAVGESTVVLNTLLEKIATQYELETQLHLQNYYTSDNYFMEITVRIDDSNKDFDINSLSSIVRFSRGVATIHDVQVLSNLVSQFCDNPVMFNSASAPGVEEHLQISVSNFIKFVAKVAELPGDFVTKHINKIQDSTTASSIASLVNPNCDPKSVLGVINRYYKGEAISPEELIPVLRIVETVFETYAAYYGSDDSEWDEYSSKSELREVVDSVNTLAGSIRV